MRKIITKTILLVSLLLAFTLNATAQNDLCAMPTSLVLTEITGTSATITWTVSTTGQDAGVYRLKVSTTPLTQLNVETGDVFDAEVSTTYHTLTNLLSPNTTYYVYVRTVCLADYNGQSRWFYGSFRTPCNSTSLPLYYDFDNSMQLPACWMTSGSYTPPDISGTTYYGALGRSLRMQSVVTGGDTYFISPPIDVAANNMEIKFKAYGPDGAKIRVGVLTNLAFPSMVIPVSSITISEPVSSCVATGIPDASGWQDYSVVTTSAATTQTGGFIVFYMLAGENRTVFIDNIDIHIKPACSKPQNVVLSNITPHSVILDWQETGTSTSWNVRYCDGVTTQTVTASSHPFTLTGLLQNTTYVVEIQSSCGSEWSRPMQFTTTCDVEAVPYIQNFDSYDATGMTTAGIPPGCWTVSNTSSTDYAPHVVGSGSAWYSPDDSKSFGFTATNNSSAYAIFPAFDDNFHNLRVKFWARWESVSYGTLDLGYVTNFNPSTFVQLTSYEGTTMQSGANFETMLDVYNIPNGARLAFRYTNASYSRYSMCIDNLEVLPIPSCRRVKDIRISDITSNSAKVSWTRQNTETQWELTLIHDGNSQIIPVSGQSQYVIPGLTPNTLYQYSITVKAICSPYDESELTSKSLSFKTECMPVELPYFEGFESYQAGGGNYPNCWNILANYENSAYPTAYVQSSSVYAHTGSKYLFFASSNMLNAYAVLPAFDSPIETLQISFYYRNGGTTGSDGTLSLGVMTNVADSTSFIPLATYPKVNIVTAVEYNFATTSLTGN
ncbi:MAG: fibronectin type III domain-containing protein, partial [Prevotellaceae bacterium]|nr:fibronectin type III domain-containing protein [Prevotellaceae bacterium]